VNLIHQPNQWRNDGVVTGVVTGGPTGDRGSRQF